MGCDIAGGPCAELRAAISAACDPPGLDGTGLLFLYFKAFRNASLEGVVNAPKYVVRAPIWILDDTRRQWLKECCLQEGIGYIIRPDNRGKKAGNQNNGLRLTNAPFLLQLDADFVPMPGILSRTIGFLPTQRSRSFRLRSRIGIVSHSGGTWVSSARFLMKLRRSTMTTKPAATHGA